uniref:TRAF-type domain-containing protein n=1 Tax=Arcella intermedia TaxID=1963864 RepID=A0A6B2L9I1_9EUKA
MVLRKDMKSHLEVCHFTMLKCPNNGCDASVLRKDMENHIATCPYTILTCPDHCDAKFQRRELEVHKEACPNHFIPCPAAPLGCDETTPRKDLLKHTSSCPIIKIHPHFKQLHGQVEILSHQLPLVERRVEKLEYVTAHRFEELMMLCKSLQEQVIDLTKKTNERFVEVNRRMDHMDERFMRMIKERETRFNNLHKNQAVIGSDLRTFLNEPSEYCVGNGTTETEGRIPAGWRLATKEETIEATKFGVTFNTATLVHSGCLANTHPNAICTSTYRYPGGGDFDFSNSCTASDQGNPNSLIKMESGSKKFLLIRIGKVGVAPPIM